VLQNKKNESILFAILRRILSEHGSTSPREDIGPFCLRSPICKTINMHHIALIYLQLRQASVKMFFFHKKIFLTDLFLETEVKGGGDSSNVHFL
jgi:hypothetical protein